MTFHVKRWLRWLLGGLVSAATPLPWLVDVTSLEFQALAQRVSRLEAQQSFRTETRGHGPAELTSYATGALASFTT